MLGWQIGIKHSEYWVENKFTKKVEKIWKKGKKNSVKKQDWEFLRLFSKKEKTLESELREMIWDGLTGRARGDEERHVSLIPSTRLTRLVAARSVFPHQSQHTTSTGSWTERASTTTCHRFSGFSHAAATAHSSLYFRQSKKFFFSTFSSFPPSLQHTFSTLLLVPTTLCVPKPTRTKYYTRESKFTRCEKMMLEWVFERGLSLRRRRILSPIPDTHSPFIHYFRRQKVEQAKTERKRERVRESSLYLLFSIIILRCAFFENTFHREKKYIFYHLSHLLFSDIFLIFCAAQQLFSISSPLPSLTSWLTSSCEPMMSWRERVSSMKEIYRRGKLKWKKGTNIRRAGNPASSRGKFK